MKPKIYIDTNLISHLSDLMMGSDDFRITDKQAEALLAICDLDVDLVTSKKMLDEVFRSKNLKQRALLTMLATLAAKVPYKDITYFTAATFGSVPFGAATFGGGFSQTDPLLIGLEKIFDPDDSEHIFQAVKNDCSYFLTLDRSTILNRAKSKPVDMKRLCPEMQFADPEELLSLLKTKFKNLGSSQSPS